MGGECADDAQHHHNEYGTPPHVLVLQAARPSMDTAALRTGFLLWGRVAAELHWTNFWIKRWKSVPCVFGFGCISYSVFSWSRRATLRRLLDLGRNLHSVFLMYAVSTFNCSSRDCVLYRVLCWFDTFILLCSQNPGLECRIDFLHRDLRDDFPGWIAQSSSFWLHLWLVR
jgi:hypothetical protein